MSGTEAEREALRWLWYALEDLILALLARQNLTGGRQVCWLAQQAAEKALKAVLVSENIYFPRTHDLESLYSRLPTGWTVSATINDLERLSVFAVEARYPGEWDEMTTEDAAFALDLARSILASVRGGLRERGLAGIDELPHLPSQIP